jgi:hypothetical protein
MPDGTGRPPCVAEHAVVDGKAWGLLKAHTSTRAWRQTAVVK